MSVTLANGPLAAEAPATVNYRIDGPAHRLFLDAFPRRVRAVFAASTVLDTTHGKLLHETGKLPQLYVPQSDGAGHLLEPSDTTWTSPYTGAARYWSLRVGDRVAHDALWSYPDPPAAAAWLRGYHGVDFTAMDAWFDEAEQVFGHLRDPYHRIDTRATDRRVRVSVGNQVLAETEHAVLLSETGLPNRLYLVPDDVDEAALTPSATASTCPYKGEADYVGAAGVDDVAWRYRDPLPEASAVAGHWCFDETKVRVEADTKEAPAGPAGRRRIRRPNWL